MINHRPSTYPTREPAQTNRTTSVIFLMLGAVKLLTGDLSVV